MKLNGSNQRGKRVAGADAQRAPAKQKKTKRRGRRVLATLFVVACVLGASAWALRLYVRPPVQQPPPETMKTQGEISDNNVQPPPPDEPKQERQVYTCLLVGHQDGNTDTIMLAALEVGESLTVVSIPRDTLVQSGRRVPKINGSFSRAGGGADGMEALIEEVAQIVGYAPSNYACVSMKGFVDLVDAIGGVTFDVPVRMVNSYEGINLYPGEQLLDGNKALQLVRYRGYSYKTVEATGIDHDDYGRMQMQQMFLKAVASQTLNAGNIGKIPEFISIAGKNLVTNMDYGNIAWFAEQALKIGTDRINFFTLPTHSIYYGDSSIATGYYEVVDSQEALEMINAYINPFDRQITASMVKHYDPEK